MPDFYATSTNNAVKIDKDVYIAKDNNLAKLADGSITEITEDMLEGATSIVDYAFDYCYSLITVKIPDSVTSIGSQAFYYCSHITSLTIGNGVATINAKAFNSCRALTEIICKATNPPTIQSNTFQYVPTTCIIKVPAGSVAAYKSATNWSARASYIQAI